MYVKEGFRVLSFKPKMYKIKITQKKKKREEKIIKFSAPSSVSVSTGHSISNLSLLDLSPTMHIKSREESLSLSKTKKEWSSQLESSRLNSLTIVSHDIKVMTKFVNQQSHLPGRFISNWTLEFIHSQFVCWFLFCFCFLPFSRCLPNFHYRRLHCGGRIEFAKKVFNGMTKLNSVIRITVRERERELADFIWWWE